MLVTLLATATFSALASDGMLQFSGAVTTPTCPVAPSGNLENESPGCTGTGRVGELKMETVGEPQDGLTLVTVQVY